MPKSHRIDERDTRQSPVRPVVLLSIADDELRARFAYELTASGFDVTVTHITARRTVAARRPDVIVAALSIESGIVGALARILRSEPSARGVPIVAIAPDLTEATRDLARREGCVAVCITSCTGAALAIGLRAVLEPTDVFSRTSTLTFG